MIIQATSTHFSDIVDLVNQAYRSKAKQGWTSEAHLVTGERISLEQVAALVHTHSTILLLFAQQKMIACVHIEKQDDLCYLGMLTTHPDFQNQGLGKIMLAHAEAWAQSVFLVSRIQIAVLNQRTELIQFYERRGYQQTGLIEPYPVNANVGIPLFSNLTVLTLEKKL